jgi:RNA polymerase-binding transcription factor DksA
MAAHDKTPSETEQILGRPVGAAAKDPAAVAAGAKIDAHWRKQYERLLQIRDRVIDEEAQLAARSRENQPDFATRSPADVGTESFTEDLARSRISSYQQMLDEINAALERIENGSYGRCELTGNKVSGERLAAVPWTRFSREAEEQLEAEGKELVHFELAPQFTVGDASSGRTETESKRHRQENSDRS